MILFQDDWDKYPLAAPDFDHPNPSMLHMCSVYKSMGVENHLWPIALIDQDLKGINPLDESIDVRTKAKIHVELKLNPWYYLGRVATVPGISGADDELVTVNRGMLALWWLFFNHVTSILIQPRQTGKSFDIDQLANYLMELRCKDTEINLLTKDDALRTKTIARIKKINATFPSYLSHRTKNDARNHKEFTIKALNNYFTAHLPSSSLRRADAIGRGFTSPINFLDEPNFQPNCHISIPAMLQSGNAARAAAKKAGEPYGTIMTTTAGPRDGKEGTFVYKQLSDSAIWTERFFDAKALPDLEQMIRNNARTDPEAKKGKKQVNLTFSHRQLGKTDEWMRESIEASMGSRSAIAADLFNQWGSGGMNHPLKQEILKTISNSKREPNYVEITKIDNLLIRWYIAEEKIERVMDRPMIIAFDTSDAIGIDDIGMTIRDPETGATIAAGDYNYLNLTSFTRWIFELMMRFPKAMIIIERKSSAIGIIDGLCEMLIEKKINPFRRLFNMVVQEQNGVHKDKFEQLKAYDRGDFSGNLHVIWKKYIGFTTTGSGLTARNKLYSDTLTESSKNTGNTMYDETLCNQHLRLREKGGRIDHPAGEHDDIVFSWLLSYFVMTKGDNIDYYGFDSLKVLSKRPLPDGTVQTKEQKRVVIKQHRYIKEIDKLKSKFMKNSNMAYRQAVRSRIMRLGRLVTTSDDQEFNIDQVLDELSKEAKMAPKVHQQDRFRNRILSGTGYHR